MSREHLSLLVRRVARCDALVVLGFITILYLAAMWSSIGSAVIVAVPYLAIPVALGWVCAFIWRHQIGCPPGLTFLSRLGHGRSRPGDEQRSFGSDSPKWIQAMGLLALASLFVGLAASPGTPVEDSGRFLLYNHSDVTHISREAFLLAQSWRTRQQLSGLAMAAVVLLMYLDDKRIIEG